MLHRIRAFLEESPGSKAKSIAAGLGLDRKDVNRLLHDSKDDFEQDLNFDWVTVSRVCTIEFPEGAWLAAGGKNATRAFTALALANIYMSRGLLLVRVRL